MNRCSDWMICRRACCVVDARCSRATDCLPESGGAVASGPSKTIVEAAARGLKWRSIVCASWRTVRFKDLKNNLAAAESRAAVVGTGAMLSRGYSITTDAASGKGFARCGQGKSRPNLKTRLAGR